MNTMEPIATPDGGVKFACPNCGQHIEATQEYVGTSATCPNCSYEFTVPNPAPEPLFLGKASRWWISTKAGIITTSLVTLCILCLMFFEFHSVRSNFSHPTSSAFTTTQNVQVAGAAPTNNGTQKEASRTFQSVQEAIDYITSVSDIPPAKFHMTVDEQTGGMSIIAGDKDENGILLKTDVDINALDPETFYIEKSNANKPRLYTVYIYTRTDIKFYFHQKAVAGQVIHAGNATDVPASEHISFSAQDERTARKILEAIWTICEKVHGVKLDFGEVRDADICDPPGYDLIMIESLLKDDFYFEPPSFVYPKKDQRWQSYDGYNAGKSICLKIYQDEKGKIVRAFIEREVLLTKLDETKNAMIAAVSSFVSGAFPSGSKDFQDVMDWHYAALNSDSVFPQQKSDFLRSRIVGSWQITSHFRIIGNLDMFGAYNESFELEKVKND